MAMKLGKWRERTRRLKSETYAIYLAYRDPRVAWYAKIFAAVVIAYAFSPIDLIPDFIPVLGYLDDLVLVPLGIALSLRMIPAEVMEEARAQAASAMNAGRPTNRLAAFAVILIWMGIAVLGIVMGVRLIGAS